MKTILQGGPNKEENAPISVPVPSTDEEKFEKLFKDLVGENVLLNDEQREEIKALIISKPQAFGVGYNDLTQTDLVQFHVDTGDAAPVYKRPYQNIGFPDLETLKQEIGDMLKAGTLIPAMHSGVEAPNSSLSFEVMYSMF